MIDYHLHTSRCCHATGTLQEYLAEAEKKNLLEIGFADHFPLDLLGHTPRVQVTMHGDELEEYIEQVEELKKASGNPQVKLGIEIDYIPGTEARLAKLLAQYDFDYIIGSIHFMGSWDFTHPVYADVYREKDISGLYNAYFKLVWDACRCGLFDIIGHIDVIKKFGYRPAENLESLWIKTAGLLKESGTCLELNTAGQDAPVGDFYPDRRLLEICCSEGVSITLGSDAHGPDQVEGILLRQSACLKISVTAN